MSNIKINLINYSFLLSVLVYFMFLYGISSYLVHLFGILDTDATSNELESYLLNNNSSINFSNTTIPATKKTPTKPITTKKIPKTIPKTKTTPTKPTSANKIPNTIPTTKTSKSTVKPTTKSFKTQLNTETSPVTKTLTPQSKNSTAIHRHECGKIFFQNLLRKKRIINRTYYDDASWPWDVEIWKLESYNNKLFLGMGTIIHRFIILTSRSVVENRNISELIVTVKTVDIRILRVFKTTKNDPNIALLSLGHSICFNRNVFPICLPKTNDIENLYNKDFYVTGW